MPDLEAQLQIPPVSSGIGEARRFTREQLKAWGLLAIADNAILMISELVTNAILHARSPVDLVVRKVRTAVRVEVYDEGSGVARPPYPDTEDAAGRGLGLVQAIATRWGVEELEVGKTVWFEITLDPR